jgi:hypothetical protein
VSLKAILKVTGPAVSLALATNEAVQVFPFVFETLTLPFTAAPPEEAVTVGDWIVSLAVKLNVTTSVGVAIDRFALLEEIDTELKVGAEVSMTTATLLESVVEVTGVPALPAVSLKEIL